MGEDSGKFVSPHRCAQINISVDIPRTVDAFPRGVVSPGSSILISGVSALSSFPLDGEDWKKIGDDAGIADSSLRRLDARGVVCSCCWRDRVECAGEAVAESLD